MYSITLLFAIVIVLATAIKQEVYRLPSEKALASQKIAIPCAKENNLDHTDMLQKVLNGSLSHDEVSKKFLYCFTLKGGFIEEDGHMIVDKIASLLGDHPLVEEFKEALRNCNKMTKENHLETVKAMNECINENAPVTFSL